VAIKKTQKKPELKLAIKFLGPYQITKILGKDRYEVCKISEHEESRVTMVPTKFLKPWMQTDSCDSEVEKENEDVSIRERISEHFYL